MFNAAYFAGLPIDESQAHSEWFDRYPRGREATMGFPEPDLSFTNNTPYGIMIWTSYTDTSLTVTLYSTPYASAEQTAIDEARSGNCDVVTTTRTITSPDGKTVSDKFRATYRPGEGQRC
jgi:vancomycin resistance protein YoaR